MKVRDLQVALLAAFLLFAAACDDSADEVINPPGGPAARIGGMILIDAEGAGFSMGSSTGNADEQPVHTVTFTYDFYIDTTEVTQAAYDLLMSGTYPSYSTPAWDAPFGVGDRYPAYLVVWADAVLYCNALSKQNGYDTVYAYSSITGVPGNGCALEDVTAHPDRNGYRLPTEAEWEFACRAGETADFYWGEGGPLYPAVSGDTAEVSSYAVWAVNSWLLSSDDAAFGTHPVATKLPSAWGLYDMSGNVTEWCHDWYDASWYANSPGTDPMGPESGAWHALRGGNWGNEAVFLRSGNREFVAPDYLYNFIGFRTVRPIR